MNEYLKPTIQSATDISGCLTASQHLVNESNAPTIAPALAPNGGLLLPSQASPQAQNGTKQLRWTNNTGVDVVLLFSGNRILTRQTLMVGSVQSRIVTALFPGAVWDDEVNPQHQEINSFLECFGICPKSINLTLTNLPTKAFACAFIDNSDNVKINTMPIANYQKPTDFQTDQVIVYDEKIRFGKDQVIAVAVANGESIAMIINY